MYIIVAKKTEKDGNEFPIVTALKWYFMKNKDDIILVSPGYMSTTDDTIQKFCEKFTSLNEEGNNQIVLSYGMNGKRLVENSSTDIIKKHYNIFGKEYPPFSTNKDHSKFLIFIENNDKLIDEYKNEKIKVMDLLNDAETNVKAVLLGSSNFSFNTYFRCTADKGEADIFMVHESLYTEKDFINSFGDVNRQGESTGRIILSKEIGVKQKLKEIAVKLIENN